MTQYEEARARCSNCENIEKCAEALGDFIWTTHIPIPKDINCEYFPKLGEAMKAYTQERIYELYIKTMNKESQND